MNFFIMLLLFLFSLTVNAREYRSLDVYIDCMSQHKGCIKLKKNDGRDVFVLAKSKKQLTIKSANLSDESSAERVRINIHLDNPSSKLFAEITSLNKGKKISIVSKNIVLFNVRGHSPITDGKFSLIIKQESFKGLELCRLLDEKCKKVKNVAPKNSLKIPSFQQNLVNKKYGKVNESLQWYSHKKILRTFKTVKMKKKTVVSIYQSSTGARPFVAFQKFDNIKQKFIYAKNLILLSTYGWVRRSDLVPGNILDSVDRHKKMIASLLLLKKCKQQIQKRVKGKKELALFLKSKNSIYRNSEVALNQLLGTEQYQHFIKSVKKSLQSGSCNKLLEQSTWQQ